MLGKLIGIIGALGIAASTFLEWSSLVFIRFEEESVKKIGGIESTQGIIAVAAGGLALILLFVKPKLAIIPGLVGIGAAAWYFLAEVSGTPRKPGLGLWVCIGCSVLVILASFMIKPKRVHR